jgi:hypothetical protein
MGRVRTALWLDLAVKAALVGLLLFAVARPDLPQFHAKAMVGRALTYPLAAVIVPVVCGSGAAARVARIRMRSTRSSRCRS